MDRNVIVYFGMGFLPEGGAVACREQAIAKMILQTGNTPVLIGIKKGLAFLEYEKTTFDGIVNYSLKYAESFQDKIKDNFVVQKTLQTILQEIGLDRIKCFMMQDYQWLPMYEMETFCKKKGIAFVPDIMDWFVPNCDYSLGKNVFKTIDTFVRMHWFYPRIKNKIYISHVFANYFQDKKNNTMVLPCTAKDVESHSVPECNDHLTITFAGYPGKKFEKEKIDWVIQALYENKSTIRLNVIGSSIEECLQKNERVKEYITDNICFMGELPHDQCLEVLRKSDFSVVARKKSKLTEFGFSSKICEAFVNGIPVIATANGDNERYIQNRVNGFTCAPCYEAVKEMLKEVEKSDSETLSRMKQNVLQNNPLSIAAYYKCFDEFIKNCESKK